MWGERGRGAGGAAQAAATQRFRQVIAEHARTFGWPAPLNTWPSLSGIGNGHWDVGMSESDNGEGEGRKVMARMGKRAE